MYCQNVFKASTSVVEARHAKRGGDPWKGFAMGGQEFSEYVSSFKASTSVVEACHAKPKLGRAKRDQGLPLF